MAAERSEPPFAAVVARGARPRQWPKNVLVFAAPAAAGVLHDWSSLWRAVMAFVAMCAIVPVLFLIELIDNLTGSELQRDGGIQPHAVRGLDGIVRAPNGMIAVVSNPQSRTYFLREGDQLYDGRVEKIAMDGVSFHEVGKDAFGKPVERQVSKRIYASAGEQQ